LEYPTRRKAILDFLAPIGLALGFFKSVFGMSDKGKRQNQEYSPGAQQIQDSDVGEDAISAGDNSLINSPGAQQAVAGGDVNQSISNFHITYQTNNYYGPTNQLDTPEDKGDREVTQEQSGFHQNIYGNDGIVIGQLDNLTIQGQPAPKLSLSETVRTQLPDGNFQSQATLTSNVPSVYPRLTIVAKANTLESIKMMPNGGVIQSYAEGTVGEAMFVSGANIVCPCVITALARENEQVTLEISDWNPFGG